MAEKPDAVVLDPDHDFLRVVKKLTNTSEAEDLATLRLVKDPAQRSAAAVALIKDGSPLAIDAVVAALRADRDVSPAFRGAAGFRRPGASLPPVSALAALKRPELRAFWMEELADKDAGRRAAAVRALAALPSDPATTLALRGLIDDEQYTPVVLAAIEALAAWDKSGNRDVFEKATKIADKRGSIAAAAKQALAP